MCKNFYTQIITEPKSYRLKFVESQALKTFIQSLSSTDYYELTKDLLNQFQSNPEDKRLQKCWECYFMNITAKVVIKEYSRFSGYLQEYSLNKLYQITFSYAYERFIQQGKCQYKIPSNCIMKFYLREVVRNEFNNPYFGMSNLSTAVRSSRAKWLSIPTTNTLLNYSLLWECVREFKASTDLPCNNWTKTHFEEIERLYNSLGETTYPQITDAQNILNTIGKSIRNLQKHISGDQPISEDTGDTIINLAPDCQNPEKTLIISQETQELYDNINLVVMGLSPNQKKMAFLNYALEYKQREIVSIMKINPSTIGHFPGSLFKKLVANLGKLAIKPTSENMSVFRETMGNYYYCKIYNLVKDYVTEHYVTEINTENVNLIIKMVMNYFIKLIDEPRKRLGVLIIRILSDLGLHKT